MTTALTQKVKSQLAVGGFCYFRSVARFSRKSKNWLFLDKWRVFDFAGDSRKFCKILLNLVECRGYGQKVGRPFFYHKLKFEHLWNHIYSHNSKNQRHEYHKVPFLL